MKWVVEQLADFVTGQKLTLTIEDIAFGGEGVGRAGEFVVFVPLVAVGEEVEVELVEIKKRFARARLVRVIKASSDRVAPQCRYFGDCGGCQYQHLAYPAQLKLKHKQIVDLFQRVGGFQNPPIAPVTACPQSYGYRNRIMIRSQWDKTKQKLNIGFIKLDNRLVVDVEQCLIAEPAVNEQITRVRQNPPSHGGIKVVLRVAPENWEVPKDSFFQNNFILLPQLVQTVRDRLKESGSRFLIDAYCGVGFFGLELADLVEQFLGVEVDVGAIKAARKNAQAKGKTNGQFLAGRTEDVLPQMLATFERGKTTLILDPPRTGCPPEMLQLLREQRPAQVLYVSCHPATLARDLNVLCQNNVFNLAKIVPLDMFPQTQHVECVADLRTLAGQISR